MGEQENRRDEKFQTAATTVLANAAGGLFLLTMLAGLVWLTVYIWRLPPSRHPDYMVSITGVDGLTLKTTSSGAPMTLSPVFNLTVRICPGSGYMESACVRGLSTAVVSYGDAFLGKGSVPPFCAEEEVQERVATAWGEDVVLPRFLRERLSAELERGEASLDVQVTGCSQCSDNKVLVCRKVKIGGGSSSPCRVERVYVQPAPAGGSASSS